MYLAARVGFEHATLLTQGIETTTEPPSPAVSGHFPPDISPGLFSPDERLYISSTKCHKSNFYLQTELFPSVPLPVQQRTFFIKCKSRLYRFLGYFRQSMFNVFATQQRFLLSLQ